MPHKALFLVNTLFLGGTERNVALLCRHIDRNRFLPQVWVLHGGGELEEPVRQSGIEVRSLHRKWAYSPFFAIRVAREIARIDADLIHAFLPTVAAYVGLSRAVCGLRKPTVLSMGQSYLTSLHHKVVGSFNSCFDEVIVNSPSARQCTLSVGVSEDRIHIIPNGHELSAYQQPVDRMAIRRSVGVGPDEVMLLTIGRLIDTKRVSDAVDATARLAGRWPVKLVVVGEGPEMLPLKQQAVNLGLGERVIFAGQRTDVPQLLEAADIFVFPSESEGLPNALIEASLARRPIVAAKCRVSWTCSATVKTPCSFRRGNRTPLPTQSGGYWRTPRWQAALPRLLRRAAREFTVEQWLNGHYDVYDRLLERKCGRHVNQLHEAPGASH